VVYDRQRAVYAWFEWYMIGSMSFMLGLSGI